MKKIIFVLIILISHSYLLAQITSVNRVMANDDPNLDPNWEWWTGNTETLYYFTTSQPNSTVSANTKLPWFINTGQASILNTENPDMYPCDGWVLIYRDFGTVEQGAVFPLFILYNKYKGLLRFFFFNVSNESYSYYMVRLSYSETTKTTANLAFAAKDKAFINEYESEQSEIAVTKSAVGQWSYVDFNLFGYDPNPTPNSKLLFDIQGINEGDLQIEGSLTSVTDKETTSFEGFNKAIKTGDNAYAFATKYFKDAEDFKTTIKKKADNNPGKWYTNLLTKIAGSAIQDAAPIIGAAAGIIQAFIGNDKSSQTQLNYDVKLSGTLSFNFEKYFLRIYVPGAPRTNANSGIPLYDKPLGVFNLIKRPTIMFSQKCLVTYYYKSPGNPYVKWITNYVAKVTDDITYQINDKVDLKVSDIQFGFNFPDDSTKFYPEQIFSNYIYHDGALFDVPCQHNFTNGLVTSNCGVLNTSLDEQILRDFYIKMHSMQLVVKLKVEPLCSVPDFSPVWVTRVYTPIIVPNTTYFGNLNTSLGAMTINNYQSFYAANSISAGGSGNSFNVVNGGNVVFRANNEIILMPDFNVENGAVFDAKLSGDNYYSDYLNRIDFIQCDPNPPCYVSQKNASDEESAKLGYTSDVIVNEFTHTNLKDINLGTLNQNLNQQSLALLEQIIEIFPNPSSSVLNIRIAEKQEIHKINIFSSSGIFVKEIECINPEMSIDVSFFQNGTYFIQFISDDGVTIKQFVKQ